MKLFNKILKWAMISLVLQFSFLFYINNFFLGHGNVSFHPSKAGSQSLTVNAAVRVPDGYESLGASFDGKYFSYILDNTLYIVDKSGNKIKSKYAGDGLSYKWLPDRNRMIIAENHTKTFSSYVSLSALDLDNNSENKVVDIKGIPKGYTVSQIELSPLTNVIYIKVGGRRQDIIYQIDIMSRLKRIYTAAKKINKIVELQKRDVLLYESSNHYIHVIDEKGNDNLLTRQKAVLLGIDSKDSAYLGIKNGGNYIDRIYFGNPTDNFDSWYYISLNTSLEQDKIFISPRDDNIYALNGDDLININDGTIFHNQKNLLAMQKDYMIYADGNNVSVKSYDNNRSSKEVGLFHF